MLKGINHITLAVKNLNQSLDFYLHVLGCKCVAQWPKGAYLLAGNVWLALIVDPRCRTQALAEYTHIAWQVDAQDFEHVSAAIMKSGAQIWQSNHSEGDSLYFEDPNGHKLEIHVNSLKARIASASEAPWEGLEIFMRPQELL